MIALSRGLRASNSSTTRGRPPVMSLVLVVSRGIFARTSPAWTSSPSCTIRWAWVGMRYLREPPGPLIWTIGCRFSSGESVTTSCDIPVTSSTCSASVMPSCRSLKCTMPESSVRIENVYGSHSSRIWLAFIGIAIGHGDARTVNHRVAFFFAALVVDDGQDTVAVHRNDFALFVA